MRESNLNKHARFSYNGDGPKRKHWLVTLSDGTSYGAWYLTRRECRANAEKNGYTVVSIRRDPRA